MKKAAQTKNFEKCERALEDHKSLKIKIRAVLGGLSDLKSRCKNFKTHEAEFGHKGIPFDKDLEELAGISDNIQILETEYRNQQQNDSSELSEVKNRILKLQTEVNEIEGAMLQKAPTSTKQHPTLQDITDGTILRETSSALTTKLLDMHMALNDLSNHTTSKQDLDLDLEVNLQGPYGAIRR